MSVVNFEKWEMKKRQVENQSVLSENYLAKLEVKTA